MKALPLTLSITVATLCGCGERTATEAPPSAHRAAAMTAGESKKDAPPMKPKKSSVKADPMVGPEAKQVSLTGTIVGVGESRGKSMAAWYGVPGGERYFELALDAQDRPAGASEPTFLRVPAADRGRDLVGKKVRVRGTWSVPTPIKTHLDDGTPLQVPIHLPAASELKRLLRSADEAPTSGGKKDGTIGEFIRDKGGQTTKPVRSVLPSGISAPYGVVARQPIFSAAEVTLR